MITFGKTTTKPNFLFKKFPTYYKINDTYKDVNDEGLLERYLEVICKEIDEEVSPYIDDILDITDATNLSDLTSENAIELLSHLSSLFGNPPDIGIGEIYSGDEDNYIKLIRNYIHIIRTKGSILGLIKYLAIYDYELDSIQESSSFESIYDNTPTPLIYDNTPTNIQYDLGFVFYTNFNLIITDKSGTTTKNPTQAWLDDYLKPAIQSIICPIWATLESISYTT